MTDSRYAALGRHTRKWADLLMLRSAKSRFKITVKLRNLEAERRFVGG